MKDYVITLAKRGCIGAQYVQCPQYWTQANFPLGRKPLTGIDINAAHLVLSEMNAKPCGCVFEVIEL